MFICEERIKWNICLVITLEIYPESKNVLMSFCFLCLFFFATFASVTDYAKREKLVNKRTFCQTGLLAWDVERVLI